MLKTGYILQIGLSPLHVSCIYFVYLLFLSMIMTEGRVLTKFQGGFCHFLIQEWNGVDALKLFKYVSMYKTRLLPLSIYFLILTVVDEYVLLTFSYSKKFYASLLLTHMFLICLNSGVFSQISRYCFRLGCVIYSSWTGWLWDCSLLSIIYCSRRWFSYSDLWTGLGYAIEHQPRSKLQSP